MHKKKDILIISLFSLLLVVIGLGVTYAVFTFGKLGTNENTITTGDIAFHYQEISGVGHGISLSEAMPIADETGKALTGNANVFDFRITSKTVSKVAIPYEITARLNGDNIGNIVKVYLTRVVNGEEQQLILNKYSDLAQTSSQSVQDYTEKTLYQTTVPANTNNYNEQYRLRIWIDENADFSPTINKILYCDGVTVDENGFDNCNGEKTMTKSVNHPYSNKNFSLTVNVYGEGTSTTDTTVPTLTLAKETYKDIPFDDSWTQTYTTINNGVLTIDRNNVPEGKNEVGAISNFIPVNGDFWYLTYDAYTENACAAYSPLGGTHFRCYYYDENLTRTNALSGDTINANIMPVQKNQWNNLNWKDYAQTNNRYGENVKYVKVQLNSYLDTTTTGYRYTSSPIQYKNLKVYGSSMPGSFYDINVTATDSGGIALLKYAQGNQTTSYFRTNGNIVVNNKITVTENGTYTVYAVDYAGNETVSTINITDIDTTAPTLALAKETYKNIPFDNTWTLNSSSINNGILSMNEAASISAESGLISVNGGFWYMTFDAYTENTRPSSTVGGINWETSYFDENSNLTNALCGLNKNGYSISISAANLGKWVNNMLWLGSVEKFKSYERYGPDVKYIQIRFRSNNSNSSVPPIQIRNLTLYGEELINDFYDIKVTSSDDKGIYALKYAKGNQPASYFRTNGNIVVDNKIRVTENGTYTVYAVDYGGNETISTINITNIQ